MLDIVKLGFEDDFIEYIDFLDKVIHNSEMNLTVLVASHDTPCGSSKFTEEVAASLCKALGTKTYLHDKMRCSYAAIIENGEVKFESLKSNEIIDYSYESNGNKIRVSSTNYNFKQSLGEEYSKYPYLVCNWRNHIRQAMRGLSFVVINSDTAEIWDAVSFDTYADGFSCKRWGCVNWPIALKKTIEQYDGALFINMKYPVFPIENLSENEKYLVENFISLKDCYDNHENPNLSIYEYIPDPEGVLEVLIPPESYNSTNGTRLFFDKKGRYVNIENGHRITKGNIENPERTIYFVGGCSMFGICARDEGTIASRLQALLNEHSPEQKINVQNYGFYMWRDTRFKINYDLLKMLEFVSPKPGDIVMLKTYDYYDRVVDCSSLSNRPHKYNDIFLEAWDHGAEQKISHLNENGYRLMADKIYETLKENDFFRDLLEQKTSQKAVRKRENVKINFTPEDCILLEEYKKTLSDFYDSLIPKYGENFRMGGIVMNCNPFTLGHRYLIESAAAKVDFLLVFVVSEDKSIFPFNDRFKLVDLGTSDLPNVGVIESGKFIISTKTFTEYFNKERLQDIVVDSSEDVTIFAQEIAPAAHISVRFVGTEPLDNVTSQYNRTLERILPEYGIEFEEIPRKENDGAPISASRVRNLLEERNFDEISKLVPKTTLEYIMKTV
jgi:[citrate (pro-3S)-lyase] ligase